MIGTRSAVARGYWRLPRNGRERRLWSDRNSRHHGWDIGYKDMYTCQSSLD